MTKLIRHEGQTDGGLDGLRRIPEKCSCGRRTILQNGLDRFIALLGDCITQQPVRLPVQRGVELNGVRKGLSRLMKDRIHFLLHPCRPFIMTVAGFRKKSGDQTRRKLRQFGAKMRGGRQRRVSSGARAFHRLKSKIVELFVGCIHFIESAGKTVVLPGSGERRGIDGIRPTVRQILERARKR